MMRNIIVVLSIFCVFFIACEDADQPEVETATAQQELWSYPSQGEILYGDIVKKDVINGDFGHVYAFEGIAGETITFVLEWHEPESNGLGAKIFVKNSWYRTIGYTKTWSDDLIDSGEFRKRKSNLGIVLGRDVAGNPVVADLAKMPHLMIAGSTGSGKTVCINTLITGLLFQNSPETLKFIMVDPKRVELTSYNDIPHLLTPVITDPDKAINSLKWSISEMESRYDLLSHLGCRNIESYNEAVKTKFKQREVLPYIVIIIDELADLMATHGREMEAAVVRLAQMARAVGIHLVLSTQRPSVEVITGLIKANITTRIAFQVASQIDSRTILDMAGAEKLLGSGDMLYLSGDSNKPKRIQGVFISEEEVRKVAGFLADQKGEENEYDEKITENKKTSLEFASDEDETDDDLYDDAVEIVRNAGKASASLLQRRLRVGYARAARLLDIMEDKGIVGPADGAKPREVYEDNDFERDAEEDEV